MKSVRGTAGGGHPCEPSSHEWKVGATVGAVLGPLVVGVVVGLDVGVAVGAVVACGLLTAGVFLVAVRECHRNQFLPPICTFPRRSIPI